MNAGSANMYRADGPAFPGDGCGTRFALGDVRIAIPVAIIAQLPHHPGGEDITSTGQAVVELAVRVESQHPLNLPIVRVEVLGERLQLSRQRAGQAYLCADEGRRDVKAAALHPRVNLCRPGTAVRTAMATQERLQPLWRDRLQDLPGRKRLEQRQGNGPIGIREQGQKLREIGLQTRGELIAE